MENHPIIEPCLIKAILHLQHFVSEVTGKEPTQEEISKVLKRYFILKEILDQIKWERENS
jgi:hypothetical protein